MTIFILVVTILADLAMGMAAYKMSQTNSAAQAALLELLKNHDVRITTLEQKGTPPPLGFKAVA